MKSFLGAGAFLLGVGELFLEKYGLATFCFAVAMVLFFWSPEDDDDVAF